MTTVKGNHPASEMFPMMGELEFANLAADINANGLRDAIVMLDGKILDGRNRLRACAAAGVAPRFVEWDGKGTPEKFVISHNLHRRHLSTSQRALVAARVSLLSAPQEKHYPKDGKPAAPTVVETARVFKVNRDSVACARLLLAHGSPGEIQAVEQGKLSVSTFGNRWRAGVSDLKPLRTKLLRPGEKLSHRGKNPERLAQMKLRSEVWGRVREALTHLTSLPAVEDVVGIARATDKHGLVDDKLARAVAYLQGFQHEWDKRNQDQSKRLANGADRPHAGDGDGPARLQST